MDPRHGLDEIGPRTRMTIPMPIYTKTGDKGTTSLFGGKRLSKANIQIEAYGTIDELTSFLGMICVKIQSKKEQTFFTTIQKDLYQIMGDLAGYKSPIESLSPRITLFEQTIDTLEKKLPKLNRFILPGGTELSVWFHIVRTICRRAERNVVALQQTKKIEEKTLLLIIQYLNRLSDLLFTYARWYNREHELIT